MSSAAEIPGYNDLIEHLIKNQKKEDELGDRVMRFIFRDKEAEEFWSSIND